VVCHVFPNFLTGSCTRILHLYPTSFPAIEDFQTVSRETAPAWITCHGLARRCSSWVTRDGPLGTLLEEPGKGVLPSWCDVQEGGLDKGLLNEATDLMGQGDGRATLADRLQSAGGGECARHHGNLSFLRKDPLPAQARWPPPSVARLSWRCQDPLLCVPRSLGVCPSREEIFQKGRSK